ncbi:MAG: cysteine desulfurase family protein [Acidimicrobiia bacterium]
MLYLDHAATTPMRREAWEAMEPFAGDLFGNSSGIHATSRKAKDALEEAREHSAELIGAAPGEVVFTSGGTEADNLAIKGRALLGGGRKAIVTSAVEHDAVLESARFCEVLGCRVDIAPVDGWGRVDPERMAHLVDEETAVVSLMTANNETGVIEPVSEMAEAAKARAAGVVVHTDAVQAFVSTEIDVERLNVDMLSLAAHKFGGPKGVGLLYVKDGVDLEPVAHGGGHEFGRRSGTHNVMGAVGMTAAMSVAAKDRDRFQADVSEARARFESHLRAGRPDVELTVPPDSRLVQHSHVRIPGVQNDTLLIKLDQVGLAASSASACQSGAVSVSHVLRAMGFTGERARECIRFTFGWTTRPDDGTTAAALVLEALERIG